MSEVTTEQIEKVEPRKWLKIDDVRYDLACAKKVAELAANSVMDMEDDGYDLYPILEILCAAVGRACDSLKESIEEWQSREPYLDDAEDVTDGEDQKSN